MPALLPIFLGVSGQSHPQLPASRIDGMAKHFYQFALFQMVKGKMDFWGWMLAGGAIWIAAGIGIRERKNR